jgi:CheY-like chemotaxis protein
MTTGRALVVDDDAANRALAKRMLTKLGWEVADAVDGTAALATLGAAEFHLVLLDISMPGLNGVQVCAEIRQRWGNRHKVVAYTAHAMEGDEQPFLDGGFDAVLIKPISGPMLSAALEKIGFAGQV